MPLSSDKTAGIGAFSMKWLLLVAKAEESDFCQMRSAFDHTPVKLPVAGDGPPLRLFLHCVGDESDGDLISGLLRPKRPDRRGGQTGRVSGGLGGLSDRIAAVNFRAQAGEFGVGVRVQKGAEARP